MEKCYIYTNDGFYAGDQIAYRRLPGNATCTPPPARPWVNAWPKWEDGAWTLVEDYRERPAQIFHADAQEGAAYWLPEDTWESQPRKMTKPGPMPDGALLERPEKPEATEDELFAALRAERDRRIAATDYLVMPDYPLEDDRRALVIAYRQALRDLPAQDGAPWDGGGELAPWPEMPSQ